MKTFKGLPIYVVAPVSADDGVIRVSLVEDPAVESNFEVFRKSSAKTPALYAVQSEERRLVRGVVLRADYPIYRRDADGDPGYYVTFPKAAIRQLAEKYLAEDRANNVDTDHDGEQVDGVRMVQLFIKDAAAGVDPEGFADIEDGSLFAEYHVTNDEIWDEIKDGTFRGFSVEIFYHLGVPAQEFRREDPDEDAGQVAGLLRAIISKVHDMSKMEKLKARLAKILAEFGSVTTDKGVIHWDGDDDLKAGDRVEVENSDGNRETPADGDYTTEDGKVIVVEDGAVSEIRDPEAEVASGGDGEEDRAEEFRRTAAKFEESYDEKERRIFDAIKAARGGGDEDYCYLVAAGDTFGVICAWGEDYVSRYYRYAVSWDGDEPKVSDPVEVRTAYVPLDFDDDAPFRGASAEPDDAPGEEDFARAVRTAETYRAENERLRARVAALEKEPAGKPAPRAYRADGVETSTGDKGLDRLAKRFRK